MSKSIGIIGNGFVGEALAFAFSPSNTIPGSVFFDCLGQGQMARVGIRFDPRVCAIYWRPEIFSFAII